MNTRPNMRLLMLCTGASCGLDSVLTDQKTAVNFTSALGRVIQYLCH